jgi:predicted unusual protein kinase regulating ubiquinone biosynthesis (AarF/ABC1/UbiB family)
MLFVCFKCAIVHGESLAALIPNSFMQAIKEAGIDVEGFLTVGVSAALRQLLEFGLFHGGPHPGNIFAMRDGRIAYVDFDNVAVLSQVCKMLLSSSRILCTYS